jgi:hypothetical protein
MPLAIACTTAEQVPVTAAPVSASGRPAAVDGALTVVVQSGDGTVIQDAATPLSFTARSGDAPGETVYLVSADADLGEGVTTITDLVTLTVTSETAAAFGLSQGAVEPKVAAPPEEPPAQARRARA